MAENQERALRITAAVLECLAANGKVSEAQRFLVTMPSEDKPVQITIGQVLDLADAALAQAVAREEPRAEATSAESN